MQLAADPQDIHALKKRRRRLPFFLLALIEGNQPLERLGIRRAGIFAAVLAKLRAAGSVVRRPPSRSMRHRLAADPTDAALEADRRDMVLAAAVRAAADLDVRAVGGGNEIGPRAQVIFEQPAQAARLRDGQPARFRAGAAGDIGTVDASASPRLAAASRRYSSRTSPTRTHRKTRF